VRSGGIFGDRIKPPGRHVTHNALIELGRSNCSNHARKAASSSGGSLATALSISSTVVIDPSIAQLARTRQIRRLS
jgi:hypothetical protein